jgi:putative sterol carrier protein
MSERARPPDDIPPREFFTRWIGDAVASDPQRSGRLRDTAATIEFEVTGEGGGVFRVEIANGRVQGHEGPAPSSDLRVRVDVETWRALNRGAISAPEALLRRRVHLSGNFLLALKLHLILG